MSPTGASKSHDHRNCYPACLHKSDSKSHKVTKRKRKVPNPKPKPIPKPKPEICKICHSPLLSDEAIILPCNHHGFHFECLSGWLLTSNTRLCPTCRVIITSIKRNVQADGTCDEYAVIFEDVEQPEPQLEPQPGPEIQIQPQDTEAEERRLRRERVRARLAINHPNHLEVLEVFDSGIIDSALEESSDGGNVSDDDEERRRTERAAVREILAVNCPEILADFDAGLYDRSMWEGSDDGDDSDDDEEDVEVSQHIVRVQQIMPSVRIEDTTSEVGEEVREEDVDMDSDGDIAAPTGMTDTAGGVQEDVSKTPGIKPALLRSAFVGEIRCKLGDR